MTFEIIFVFLLLGIAVFLFVTKYVTYDIVALIIMASLLLSGVLSLQEGLSGFSNSATITVACMFILSAGVKNTGILERVGEYFADKMDHNFHFWFFWLLLCVAVISAFINNTAAVAIFIPVMMGISARIGVSPSKMLIPLSFAGMFGGVTTLIGTSTNILVSSIAAERALDPIGMFELTPMGIVFMAAGFLFLFTIGTRMIPSRRDASELTEQYGMQDYLTDVQVMETSDLIGKKLNHQKLTEKLDLDVIRVFKEKGDSSAQRGDVYIEPGDIMRVRGKSSDIQKLQLREDLTIFTKKTWGDKDLEYGGDLIVEVVIAPESSLVKSNLDSFPFADKMGALPLAIRQRGELKHNDLNEVILEAGDSLLLSISAERMDDLQKDSAFIIVSKKETQKTASGKTVQAIAILAAVVITAALGIFPIVITALSGAVLMILTGCLRTEEAYRAINWKVIMLLAGVLPLGTAMDKTGAAQWMASGMLDVLADSGPTVLLSGFFGLTLLVTSVMSNNASAALLAPIAIEAAGRIGVSPEPLLYSVTFAASLSLITPFGYQTNTMIFGPGHYEIKDFLKIGTVLNLIFWVLATLLIPVIWPF
ncbi:SLC13 family permease [Rhodohalobacter mucosus]|uniref:SLC13 family permease n=1 Tax=Rhodohalobacter mucosus TaxID=2079485 RepID=A0A316TW66_9BACT|nr:SLC13 family permease [Rhodohalobacter mucosus]PWN06802.1 SLC13 family permease [Rhodohalobacter mucosus]